jgi:hypothetical protein
MGDDEEDLVVLPRLGGEPLEVEESVQAEVPAVGELFPLGRGT